MPLADDLEDLAVEVVVGHLVDVVDLDEAAVVHGAAGDLVELLQDAVVRPTEAEPHPEDRLGAVAHQPLLDLLRLADTAVGPGQDERRVRAGVVVHPVHNGVHGSRLVVAATGRLLGGPVAADVAVHRGDGDRLRGRRDGSEEPDLHLVVVVEQVGDRDHALERALDHRLGLLRDRRPRAEAEEATLGRGRPGTEWLVVQRVHRAAGVDQQDDAVDHVAHVVLDQHDRDLVLAQVDRRGASRRRGRRQLLDQARSLGGRRHRGGGSGRGCARLVVDADAGVAGQTGEAVGEPGGDAADLELADRTAVDLADDEGVLGVAAAEIELGHHRAARVRDGRRHGNHTTERAFAHRQRDADGVVAGRQLAGVDAEALRGRAAVGRRGVPGDALSGAQVLVVEHHVIVTEDGTVGAEEERGQVDVVAGAVRDDHAQRADDVGQGHVTTRGEHRCSPSVGLGCLH